MARGVFQTPQLSIDLYSGGDSLSRISWRKLAKVSVGCAGALAILLFLLFCWATYGPDKHELTKHARVEWSRKFRQVGLDGVPVHAKYWGGAYDGYWAFRVDIHTMHQWLSKSQSLRTAEVRTKPGKKAYLFYAPASHKACLVIIVFCAPHWNHPLPDGEAVAVVHTIDIGAKENRSTCTTQAVKDALEEQVDYLNSIGIWAED